ncbi:hypothetical protein [Vreelandella neptunia]|jgi:uncharacterized protein involved in cysteine biosynthesis|uniref:Uncharacterized protein n=1 Tax=Vreelandella neptunia TaxID=115551 RepID=A0ABS9S9S5_9GAMM|nr:hypothetical protein [Halomonas neptunia]MCH4812867.1 hypothetical protein [Halomonas neptunia]
MNKYNELPKLINKEESVDKGNPFITITIIQLITFILAGVAWLFISDMLNMRVIDNTFHSSLDVYFKIAKVTMTIMFSLAITMAVNSLLFRVMGIKNGDTFPFFLFFASKIYKKKTGKELTGDSYKELMAKLDRAGMIEKPRTIIDYEIEEVEKEITVARANLAKLEAKKNKKLKGEK